MLLQSLFGRSFFHGAFLVVLVLSFGGAFFGGSNFWRRGMDWDVFLIVVLNPIMTCTALTFVCVLFAVPWLMMMMVLSPTSPPKFMTATATTDYYPSLACLVADLIRFNWGWWFFLVLWTWSFVFCLHAVVVVELHVLSRMWRRLSCFGAFCHAGGCSRSHGRWLRRSSSPNNAKN